ncbi:MAG: aldose 1-epimerase family protein [Bacilli bacterium]
MNKDYFSHLRDAIGATRLTFQEGKAKGMEVIIAHNGVLTMYILPERGMDLYRLEYKGENVAYISPNGPVSPFYLGSEGNPFAATFIGGFLLTCGLDNVMGPEEKNGKTLVQHGSYTYIPARDLKIDTIEEDEIRLEISGKMEMTAIFGTRITLKRTIILNYGEPTFTLRDEISNEGDQEDEYMVMYHHNLGYPLFNERSVLKVDNHKISKISDNAIIDQFDVFDLPKRNIEEEVFLHSINKGEKEHVSLENENYRLTIAWNQKHLPYMVQWKCLQKNNYVLGLEPAMSPYPQKKYRQIKPEEKHEYQLKYQFTDK